MMAPPVTMCVSCLRTATRAATRTSTKTVKTTHQSSRTYIRAAVASPLPLYLDFLAPAALRDASRSLSTFKPRTSNTTLMNLTARRALATSSDLSSAKPAQAIQNPRTDDSGNPMLISISPRASNRLHKIAIADNNPNLALRVSVESGGCHGFQYLMDLTDLSKAPATEEDTVFEGEKGEKVVIDEPSLELLNGSTVDYTMELIGSQFKVTGIPGATSSCGCGTSFDIKL